MKFLLLILPFFLWANPHYPSVFSSISDKIYQHLDAYKELAQIEYFAHECEELNEYIKELELLKSEGFELEHNLTTARKNAYAKAIRNQDKKLKYINDKISKKLVGLLNEKEFGILILLKESSLDFVKNSYEVAFVKEAYKSPMEQNETVESQISLEGSLSILKDKLINSRETNSTLSNCLNDITSINYFLIKIDKEILLENPCKALSYINMLKEYDKSSQISCKEELSYYDKWHTKSENYRTILLAEVYNDCLLK